MEVGQPRRSGVVTRCANPLEPLRNIGLGVLEHRRDATVAEDGLGSEPEAPYEVSNAVAFSPSRKRNPVGRAHRTDEGGNMLVPERTSARCLGGRRARRGRAPKSRAAASAIPQRRLAGAGRAGGERAKEAALTQCHYGSRAERGQSESSVYSTAA